MRGGRVKTWTKEQLIEAVKNSFSIRQVLISLNLREAGGNYAHIKKYIKEYGLDKEHFRGQAWSKGLRGIGRPQISLEDILVKGSNFQSYKLRNRLFATGLKPQHCEDCGWAKHTSGGYLPLELDHVNGDRSDNRLKNLKILCPNCHSLTPTHRGRRRLKK